MVYTKGVIPYQISSLAHPRRKSVVVRSGTIGDPEIFLPHRPQTKRTPTKCGAPYMPIPHPRGVCLRGRYGRRRVYGFLGEALDFAACTTA